MPTLIITQYLITLYLSISYLVLRNLYILVYKLTKILIIKKEGVFVRIFICNQQNIWKSELTDGFIALGHDVERDYPETPEAFATMLQNFKPHLLITLGGPTQYDNSLLEYIGNT